MKDISQCVPDAARFDGLVIGSLVRAVSHTTTVLTMRARSRHRWKDITFKTRESITGETDPNSAGASGLIKAGAVAAMLNAGTVAHRIEARNAKFLRFQQGGSTVFRRGVNHPGTAPDPFLDAVADEAMDELWGAVDDAIGDIL